MHEAEIYFLSIFYSFQGKIRDREFMVSSLSSKILKAMSGRERQSEKLWCKEGIGNKKGWWIYISCEEEEETRESPVQDDWENTVWLTLSTVSWPEGKLGPEFLPLFSPSLIKKNDLSLEEIQVTKMMFFVKQIVLPSFLLHRQNVSSLMNFNTNSFCRHQRKSEWKRERVRDRERVREETTWLKATEKHI